MSRLRSVLVASVVLAFAGCGGSAVTTSAAQSIAVQIVPALVELLPAATYPFAAYVVGTADTGVTWEVVESAGGTIDAAGTYSAPDALGTYHVVARSKAAPTMTASAAVTVTQAPQLATGAAIGANLSWWSYWDEQAFADTARQGNWRNVASTDANGWPASDCTLFFGVYAAGTYKLSFTGQATLGGSTVQNVVYTPATNRTTADVVFASAPSSGVAQLSFSSTRRLPGDAPGTGLTDLKLMRPGMAADVGTPATRFDPSYIAALKTFQWFRAMQTMGKSGFGVMGNSDVYWSEADAAAAGVAAYQAGATYRFGQTARANGKTYLASFGAGTMSGAAGSSAPNHNEKVAYDQGGSTDGAVHWGRATRALPFGCGSDGTGPAWEDIIMLANRSQVAPWITIPYFASDLYVTKLARLVRYGSDATGEPYTSPQANPVYPPLDPALPIIVEWSNEIWNGFPYPGAVNAATATSEYGAGNPWQYTSTDVNVRAAQRSVMLTVRMSILFRQVFGDVEMMTRVRPVWAGQLGYASSTPGDIRYMPATAALGYVNSVWGPTSPSATVNGQPNPKRPVGYYLYGIAGAPYDDWSGSTVDALFASWTANIAGIQVELNNWDTLAAQYGLKTLAYEGSNQQTSTLVTQAQADPRYQQALTDLVHAFWRTPRGTADAFAHFRMTCSANNSGLGYPAATPYGNGNYVSTYLSTISDRNTPAWNAMRALRAETGR